MASNKKIRKIKYALRFIPDKMYIQIYYFARLKKFCNLRHPKTYNEKLNWLKLHDHNPLYTELVDKYEVKKYVSNILGGEYTIPTLGVWEKFDDIDFDLLPNQFVLKCTHDSEGLVIVKDKSNFDKIEAKKKLEAALGQNFYYIGREWPYKNVKPRIIAEKYMEDSKTGELRDYKFFCFGGVPKIVLIAQGRDEQGVKIDFFNSKFEHLDMRGDNPNADCVPEKPIKFDEMLVLAEKLSSPFCHVRVDFYEVDGRIYFGEFTFFHHSGFANFHPSKWDEIMGDWIKLHPLS